jgi:small GTP-binding protein
MTLVSPEVGHKVVFLGDSNTGKTSIIFKYLKLAQQPFPTIAVSSFPMSVPIQDTSININCWDTAGQDNYRCLVPICAREAEVACLVFDQTNKTSFQSLEGWLKYIQSDIGIKNIVIVSNKNDLEPVVPLDEAFEYCTDRNLPLIATSALTGSNITFLFIKIAQIIYEAAADRVQRDRQAPLDLERRHQNGCCV